MTDKPHGIKKFLPYLPAIALLIAAAIGVSAISAYLPDTQTATHDASDVATASNVNSDTNSYSVTFSHKSGFYDDAFSLTLSAPDGFTIYYTVDCSEPDEASAVYTAPIEIEAGATSFTDPSTGDAVTYPVVGVAPSESFSTAPLECAVVIRAIAIDENGVRTDVATATYFIGCDVNFGDKELISIVCDPDDLYGDDDGIYVLGTDYDNYVAADGDIYDDSMANYQQSGRDYERAAHIDLFDQTGEYLFSQEAGIRINGASSRSSSLKSFRLYARKEYDGNSRFTYPLVSDGVYPNSVILRLGTYNTEFLPTLVSDRNIAIQQFTPCTILINGKYFGEYYLLERFDAEYFDDYYNVKSENVTIRKDSELFSGSSIIYDSWQELTDFVTENDLSDSENYDYVCSQLDIASYIDYYAIQVYWNNYDYSTDKNTVVWRSNELDAANPYADCRWRYALMDLDFTLTAYGELENYTTNSFSNADSSVWCVTDDTMFTAFLQNDTFRQQFVTTFMDLENVNFAYDAVAEKIDAAGDYIGYPDIWKEFFEKRPDYINGYLAETFSLNGALADVTIAINDTDAGFILLNTVTPDLSEGEWTGRYFTDFPVTVTAQANEGYRFDHWEIDGEVYDDETLSVKFTEDGVHIKAVYNKD